MKLLQCKSLSHFNLGFVRIYSSEVIIPSYKSIKKSVTIFLYLATLSYLLPFRPGYFYYISHQGSAATHSNYNKKEELHFAEKAFLKSDKAFTVKDRSQFDFDGNILIPSFQNEFEFTYAKITTTNFYQSNYSALLTLSNSNRGSPTV